MRCKSCNKALSDVESSLKFDNWEEIQNPEDRYIDLCGCCLHKSDLASYDLDDIVDEEIDSEEFEDES